jgi:hypothetical protein
MLFSHLFSANGERPVIWMSQRPDQNQRIHDHRRTVPEISKSMSQHYSPTKPKRTVSGYMRNSIDGCLTNVLVPLTPMKNFESGFAQASSPIRSPSTGSMADDWLAEGTSALPLTGDRLQAFNSIRVLGDHLSRSVVAFLIRHVGMEFEDEKSISLDSDEEELYASDDGQKKMLLKGAAYLHKFNGSYDWDASKAEARRSRRAKDNPGGLGDALATLDTHFLDKRKVGAFGLLAANDAVGTTEQTYRRQKRVTRTQTSIQLLLQTYEWTEQSKGKNNIEDTASKELSYKGVPPAEKHECALLFVDISGFTKLSTMLPIEQLSKVSWCGNTRMLVCLSVSAAVVVVVVCMLRRFAVELGLREGTLSRSPRHSLE